MGMKSIGNRLLNIVLVVGAVILTGFIVNYYFSYWNTATARNVEVDM